MQSTTDTTLDGTTSINQDALNNLLNSGTQSLIPESMQTILLVSFILLNVATLIFIIGYIVSLARKWKVQTAILKMHDDVIDIKQSLKTMTEAKAAPTEVIHKAPMQPSRIAIVEDSAVPAPAEQ